MSECINLVKASREWKDEYNLKNDKDLYIHRLTDLNDKLCKYVEELEEKINTLSKPGLNSKQISICENMLIEGPMTLDAILFSFYSNELKEDETNFDYDRYNAALDIEELISMGYVETYVEDEKDRPKKEYLEITRNSKKRLKLINIVRTNGRTY